MKTYTTSQFSSSKQKNTHTQRGVQDIGTDGIYVSIVTPQIQLDPQFGVIATK